MSDELRSQPPGLLPPDDASRATTPGRVTLDWVVFILAMLLCGLSLWATSPWLLSARGGFGPTVAQAVSPVGAVVAVGLALVACTIIGAGAGRLLGSPGKGLVIIGLGLTSFAWRLDGVEVVAFSGSLPPLALEDLGWALAILIMSVVVFRIAGPLRYVQPRRDEGEWDHWASSPAAGLLVASGLVALPVVWVIAQSPARGQVLAAVVAGGVGAGLAARLVAPHIQPILVTMAVVLAGALTQGALAVWIPGSDAGAMMVAGDLPGLLFPMPIDWAAGALVGVPIGLSFGNSFLQHEPDSPNASVA